MPFYFRQSVKAGPFRFNFSKNGVGLSVGIRGLRIGTGPRGHYVHAGIGGLYYRASLGKAGQRRRHSAPPAFMPGSQGNVDHPYQSPVEMIEVISGNIEEMRNESHAELIDEINSQHSKIRMSLVFGLSVFFVSVLIIMLTGSSTWLFALAAIPAALFGHWLDSYKRASVLYYDLEPDAASAYQRLTDSFDSLLSCAGKWHIEAGGAVTDLVTWKQNAGASHLVRRKQLPMSYALPTVIKSNVTPPCIHVRQKALYFFPDVALVEERGKIGAIAYRDLFLRWQDSSFIEEERVPADAQIIGQTWKHPNKKGGPDRRFSNNRQLPICLYEALHFFSVSGLNELVQVSRTGVGAPFNASLSSLKFTLIAGSYKAPAPTPTKLLEGPRPEQDLKPIGRPVISGQKRRKAQSRRSGWSVVIVVFLSFVIGVSSVVLARPAMNLINAMRLHDKDDSPGSATVDNPPPSNR